MVEAAVADEIDGGGIEGDGPELVGSTRRGVESERGLRQSAENQRHGSGGVKLHDLGISFQNRSFTMANGSLLR